MLWSQRSSAPAEQVILTRADPRLRRTLSERLSTASVCDIERLSWVYWLLRTRQPRKVLMNGHSDDGVLLMAAAAVSIGQTGRIHAAGQRPREHTLKLLADAGLDWVLRRQSLTVDAEIGTGFDAAVVCGAQWSDDVLSTTRRLSAGALIIALGDPGTQEQMNSTCAEMLQSEPALESLMLSPLAMPVITMIWRGN
ncbi:hypothetical protein [Wenzhouxiangella limi]|uniref:Uncharacterized protein n=1 Tax=Wenzhouxiangella limi TaxID=2707351 RepID=A0A845UZC4_9GAMM|nr:hypothetical protein [Wenzhouxiangella limi]NDY95834.1 hypothetical protein [Wenzhouxiangella limi]